MTETIKVVSFDLDGTLVDDAFDQAIWFREIPARYAAKHGLSFEEAKAQVLAEYRGLKGHPRWTDMGFWFDRFGIGDWQEAAQDLAFLIRLYPETMDVVRALAKHYRLIIITQSEPKFYQLKLQVEDLGHWFERVYATPERFNKLAKDIHVYGEILVELGLEAAEMVHVGDNLVHDYEVPRRVGIQAFLLDREGEQAGAHVIQDLTRLPRRVALLSERNESGSGSYR